MKTYFIKKINLEFEEMMLHKAAGKLMEEIRVRDYCLGDSLPVIKGKISLCEVHLSDNILRWVDSCSVRPSSIANLHWYMHRQNSESFNKIA